MLNAVPGVNVVECWIFRVTGEGRLEVLLMRRSAGRIYAGLWQPVTGRLQEEEAVTMAVLREAAEETGIGPDQIEGFYTLDQVVPLYAAHRNGIAHLVIFAIRIRPQAAITISHEHDAMRWVEPAEAVALAIWPAYRESLARIERLAREPDYAYWFELDDQGRRKAS